MDDGTNYPPALADFYASCRAQIKLDTSRFTYDGDQVNEVAKGIAEHDAWRNRNANALAMAMSDKRADDESDGRDR